MSIGNLRRFNGTVAEHHGRRKGRLKSDGVDGHASMRPCSTPQGTSAKENDIVTITYCGTCERCCYAIHRV